MWNIFKKIFSNDNIDSDAMSNSIQKIVHTNALNKRKNLRINFPHISAAGPYPRVFYKDGELLVANISVGGLLVIDDTKNFGSQVGEVVLVHMNWDDHRTKMRARLVGAHGEYRHLQFVDFDPQVFVRVTQMVKPGHLGNRFRRVHDNTGQITAKELWVGPSQESLVFNDSSPFLAELNLGPDRYQFYQQPQPKILKHGESLNYQSLSDLLVLLANFPKPTPLVKHLVELVDTVAQNSIQQKTG